MSSTDIAYGLLSSAPLARCPATDRACGTTRRVGSGSCGSIRPAVLRTRYEVSGTDIGYAARKHTEEVLSLNPTLATGGSESRGKSGGVDLHGYEMAINLLHGHAVPGHCIFQVSHLWSDA
eukprot:961320-Rhodomonas_salina.2